MPGWWHSLAGSMRLPDASLGSRLCPAEVGAAAAGSASVRCRDVVQGCKKLSSAAQGLTMDVVRAVSTPSRV